MIPVSGTQHRLRTGDYEAVVAGVGASLRSLTHDGRDLVVPFDADELRPGYRGATLAPWPNRVVDGRYSFDGVEHELALNEPRRGHALHGLVGWAEFEAVDKGAGHVTLATTIEPQTGYPWRLVVETSYELSPAGLVQSVRARNESPTPAPWGTGPHPYLVAGSAALDSWTLSLPAAEVLEVTPDRLTPTTLSPVSVDSARFDFRAPRALGPATIDHAFTSLERDDGGFATVTITDAAGVGTEMSWGGGCAWVQVHTADLPDRAAPGHRIGLAVEPMTCAPDAFNAASYAYDTGLQTIAPGEWSTTASWSIRARG